MLKWEYALLVRRRQPRLDEAGWELVYTWYGPDGAVLDVSAYGDTALAHLNRAGAQGWELVSVTEDGNMQGSAELHRYHMKRPIAVAPTRPRIRSVSRSARRAVG